ncbi:MAG: nucleoside-diphosphate kinase, partial [Candidatus Njordarchaeota archaeon]
IEKIPDLEFLCFEEIYADKDFLANQHYVEHKGKFFYDWLVNYIASSPILFSIIRTKEENVKKIREILGPTLPEKAIKEAPNTIRALYGIMGGVNVAHASDAVETAKRESSIWAPHLKEKYGIDINSAKPEDVLLKIKEYINRYIDYPIVDSARYRELLEELKRDLSKRKEIEEHIAKLIAKETEQQFVNKNLHKILAKIIIDNILLKK